MPGYGGTSYNRVRKQNQTNSPNYDFNGWATSGNDATGYSRGYYTSSGIASNFEYELFAYAGFADNNNVGRFYVNYASISLATMRNVVSDLSDCTLTGNFYGGGNLGKVDGNITSTLTACHVMGNVFGAGFSASVPTVEVMKQANFEVAPYYNGEIGAYTIGLPPATETYTWSQLGSNASPFTEDENGKWIYTNQDLSSLGTVTGDVTLSIAGTTHIMGDVYGGGALANSNTNLYRSQASTSATTTVNLKGGTIEGNAYGGGLGQKSGFFGATTDVEALVGNTLVKLNENTATDNCVVLGNIFGCNNLNGTPKGTALVHVYKTVGNGSTHVRTAFGKLDSPLPDGHSYELKAVYGGGNLSAYQPMSDEGYSEVIIDGCSLSSIEYVYGGGNAASVPATKVTVNGAYEIEGVFGGGNGKDALPNGQANPGANVGYLDPSPSPPRGRERPPLYLPEGRLAAAKNSPPRGRWRGGLSPLRNRQDASQRLGRQAAFRLRRFEHPWQRALHVRSLPRRSKRVPFGHRRGLWRRQQSHPRRNSPVAVWLRLASERDIWWSARSRFERQRRADRHKRPFRPRL